MRSEAAKELLAKQKLEDADVRRKRRIAQLKGSAAEAAAKLLDEHWFISGQDPRRTSASLLEALSPKDREAVFTAMQPSLGAQLERMWQAGRQLPYQVGFARRAFRAPASQVTLRSRHQRLLHVLDSVRSYEPADAAWVARWAAHLSSDFLADSVGTFLASVIDEGGRIADDVFEILVASAEGEDEVGAMGRHVSRALLTASRPDGWAFVEKLLLAAQRQEGLRQTVLETVDEAHPEAFRRMVRLIVDKDLARFPATVRSIDVWFGLAWGSGAVRGLNDLLSRVLRFLDDSAMRDAALRSGTAEDSYLALWCRAFVDAPGTVKPAAALLNDGDPARRFVAVHLLAQLGLTTSVAAASLRLDDPDLRVAARALDAVLGGGSRPVEGVPADTFERLERLLARLDKPSVALEAIVWPWTARTLERQAVAGGLVTYLDKRPPSDLIRHLPSLDADGRAAVARTLVSADAPSAEVRRALLTLAGDPSVRVRAQVVQAVTALRVTDAETLELEGLLTRKTGDLRRAIVAMLLARGEPAALASADRLLAATGPMQRLAGLEVLRRLVETGRSVGPARERGRAYRGAARKLSEGERTQLAAIVGAADNAEAPGYDGHPDGATSVEDVPAIPRVADAFGLLDVSRRSTPAALRPTDAPLVSDASMALIVSLDDLVHEHRDAVIAIDTRTGPHDFVLGEMTNQFPPPPGNGSRAPGLAEPPDPATVADDVQRAGADLPLHDIWERWWTERGPELRDGDGLELIRAHFSPVKASVAARPSPTDAWNAAIDKLAGGGRPPVALRYQYVTAALLGWLAVLHPAQGTAQFLLDAAERLMSAIPPDAPADGDRSDWQNFKPGWRAVNSPWLVGLRHARNFRRMRPDQWGPDDHARLWRLERWVDEGGGRDLRSARTEKVPDPPGPKPAGLSGVIGGLRSVLPSGRIMPAPSGAPGRQAPPFHEIVAAYRAGAATDDDVIDGLAGPGAAPWFRPLGTVSGRRPPARIAADPRLVELIDRVRRRLVEVELRRGEAPTEASGAALKLTWSGGLEPLARLLNALGREPFIRGFSYDGESRQVVFSRLIRATMPGPDDTPGAFAARMRAANIPERRLVELGCFAPQWAEHVEATVDWPGLASAIWWMHAHTKDPSWVVAAEIKEAWATEIAERTPLDTEDLVEGAVDVAWFERVYAEVGPERWKVLHGAAKYSSTGGGHTRAQLFGDAMRGAVGIAELEERLKEKRTQDVARAIGLVPLPGTAGDDGRDEREAAVLARYRTLQEYVRTSRQFGSSRQASEKRAAEIGLQNLARTAGYADPVRLGWAMEARGVADLADGPLTANAGDVQVRLAVDARGEPDLSMTRDGVPLKALPAAAKGSKEITALRSRATDLRRQTTRIRRSLEGAMIRGDAFRGSELVELAGHLLLGPQLARLVVIGDGIAGYPIAGGLALAGPAGREQAVGASDVVRIAHPTDLRVGGAWHDWQADAFRREIVQPFKQVFRELYVPTAQELADGTISRRYAGHQVGPRQALALLGGRGWVNRPEEGVRRTFHDVRLSAALFFTEPFFSPAEVDGLTLEEVRFFRSGSDGPVPIAEVPPRIFSEVMRDLDLVVSVAHAGGVDPEATASTVEMRASLVTETCRLLEVPNVRVDGPRAVIEGELAEYSVHLGSAIVHRRPGGALFIVPVHAQNRGRLFLPFVDDDPKTAEVLAKVLMLARDREIKDTAILDQIRHG